LEGEKNQKGAGTPQVQARGSHPLKYPLPNCLIVLFNLSFIIFYILTI